MSPTFRRKRSVESHITMACEPTTNVSTSFNLLRIGTQQMTTDF
ncbi:hypothetical protein T11_17989 [Trichinella zimbabwensis]|uniref:Uncharacterized protein n=1 Tax=Trichinella zimbabwensis TaxID=268475 RepID=A0A0V1GYP1_9BILA|nr:hypothetical protein T11_17989 [Trichinella zimbabwensis]